MSSTTTPGQKVRIVTLMLAIPAGINDTALARALTAVLAEAKVSGEPLVLDWQRAEQEGLVAVETVAGDARSDIFAGVRVTVTAAPPAHAIVQV